MTSQRKDIHVALPLATVFAFQKDRTDRTLLHLQRFLELAPDAPEAARVEALLSRLR